MKFLRWIAALVMLGLAVPAMAQTLIDNVNGITLDADGKLVRFSALVITPDGKVDRLVKRGDKPPKTQYRMDGKGKTLMPGLIDAHGHVMGIGLGAIQLDLSSAKSLDEAKQMIAEFAAKNPDSPWIIGRGWNQESWGLGRFPTAADIDAITGGRPVWLERVDGHAGWANSKAMELAGITPATKSPAGGRIEMAGDKPSGIFVDAAMELVSKSIPPLLPLDRERAFIRAQDILLSYGITGMADMGTSIEDWMAYRRAGDEGYLRVRIFAYAAGIPAMLQIGGTRPSPWLYNDKLRMAGVKLYLDGALGSRGAWLKLPYADAPGQKGLAFMSDAAIRNSLVRAAMDKFQVAVHAIGDAANDQILGAIEEVAETYPDDRRWRIEHAQIVDPADIARFSKHGIIASMQPVHQTSDRTMAEARLGPARLKGAYAWQSILKAGGKLALGSDAPVENPNPFPGIAVAISRVDAQNQPFGGWFPEERLSREQALAGFTIWAAYASFAETKVGRLGPGMWADFILVDTDVIDASPGNIRNAKVSETWVAGQKVWSLADSGK